MNPTRRELMLSGAALLGGRWAHAQEPSGAIFTTGVKVVNVFATVRAKNGAIIRDLSKDDFALTENGRPQAIRYFSRETDLPLTIGLMIDTSVSQLKVLDSERGASFRFLDQVLRDKQDQFFIMQFDLAVLVRQDLTSSRKKLEEALEYVDSPSRLELSLQRGGGTLLYDAIVQASKDIMKNQSNRKALIVLSDGVDTGSETSMADAIEAAQRADTLVYSIVYSGSYAFGGAPVDGGRVLSRISRETGGSAFEVSKKQNIEQIFNLIQDELRSQYSLGFVSDTPVRVSEFRKLQLTAKGKNLVVQTRDRYWAQR
jgi:VWFA-related protein